MNKIFKIKRNALGQSIVTSELAKSRSKTGSLATALVASLLSIGTAIATPSTVGQGNLVTGEKGVTDGYNNTVTAIKGTAQGNDSIATGNNLSREEFSAKLNEHNTLLSDKTSKEGEIGTLGTNIEANNQAQTNLNNQIQDLNKIIDRATEKSGQLDNLNNQLMGKQNELTPLIETLERAKQNATSPSSTGTGDKTIWTDFTAQLGKLNWNKLSDSSNGTSGVNKLATDLKSMIEADYPDYTNRWEMSKYEEVINGYINRQGLFDANEDNIGVRHKQNRDYYSFKFDISGPKYVGNIFEYNTASNKGNVDAKVNSYALINYLENVSNVKVSEISIETLNSINSKTYIRMLDGNDEKTFYAFYNLKNIINSNQENAIQNIAKSYNAIVYDYAGYRKGIAEKASDLTNAISLLSLPPVNKKSSVEFVAQRDLAYFVRNTFKNELASVNNGIISDQNNKAFISNTDINYLRNWISLFYDNFYNNINFEAEESNWLFDKKGYVSQLSKVENFAAKLKEYVSAYDNAISNPNDANAQIKLVTLYNDIRQNKDNNENYYENIKVNLKQSTIDLFNQYAEKTANELTEDAQKVKLYDARNEVIKGVITAAQDLKKGIDDAQKAVNEKQKEIDGINQQIKDLALTPDKQGAADLKRQKEQELADKQAEKTQLEQDKSVKQAELDEINRKLNETGLANLGKNSIALGTNAFASGDDSIAMGTNATVTSNDGIAIGRDSNVTGKQSIALGAENTVSGDKSIAIGVGHNVSGNRSSTIGDPNTITGDDVFVAGNNNHVASNNVMVMGNNITVGAGFDNAVVLGANSAIAAANAVANIDIGGKTYNFAGTAPNSVVSIGAAGQERQIINVAAGRVTESSTDAINGSQLYALAEAVKNNKVNPQDVSDEVTNQIETKLVAGKNINIDKDEATKTFTISATDTNTQSVVKAGNGVNVSAIDNAQGTKDYTVSVSDALIKAGNNVEVTGDAQNGFTINAKPATTIKAGEGVSVSGDSTNGYTITNTAQDANTQSVTKAGQGVTVTSTDNAQGTKDYTVSVKAADGLTVDGNGSLKVNDNLVKGGKNTEVSGNAKDGFTINAKGAELTAGDNITLSGNASDGYTITAKNTQSVVKAGDGVSVAESDNTQGTKDYTVSINTGNGLTTNNGKVSVKDDLVKAGQGITVSGNAGNGFIVNAKGTQLTAGDNIRLTGDAVNGYTITAVATAVEVTKDQLDDLVNKVGKIVDTNTQSVTKAGQGVTVTETDNAQGTKDYTVSINTGAGLKLDNGKVAIKEDLIKAGNGVTVSGNAENGFTVTAKGTQLTAGDNITLTGDATNGYIVTAKNSQSVTKAGDGISVTATDNAQGTKDYTISIKDGLVKAGDNVKVSGNAKDGFTLSAKNTQSTSSVVPNKGLAVTTTDNADGTKNYAFEAKVGDGLGFDENGNIRINNNLVKAGDNIEVSGNAKDGYTMSVDNMRSVVEGGRGASVAVKENADGSKTYTVTIKAGEGLTVDSQGNIVNDLKLQAGDNVKVSGNAKDGYTLSAIDTNTQATVSAINQTGIVVTTTNNANGTKNYDVSAKLGDGLYVNDKGEISATAKTMQVKGDDKNITTTTDSKGDVSVKLTENLNVKSVKTGDVSISTVGIHAGNRAVTGVADGEIAPNSTDAVNGSQLYATHQYINQMAGQVVENTQNIQQLNGRIGNVEQRLDKTSKDLKAGIAGTAAIAGLPQVRGNGKSMVSAAVGNYKGQNAIAVGYSRASDNGKVLLRLSGSANTRGDVVSSVGVGYEW